MVSAKKQWEAVEEIKSALRRTGDIIKEKRDRYLNDHNKSMYYLLGSLVIERGISNRDMIFEIFMEEIVDGYIMRKEFLYSIPWGKIPGNTVSKKIYSEFLREDLSGAGVPRRYEISNAFYANRELMEDDVLYMMIKKIYYKIRVSIRQVGKLEKIKEDMIKELKHRESKEAKKIWEKIAREEIKDGKKGAILSRLSSSEIIGLDALWDIYKRKPIKSVKLYTGLMIAAGRLLPHGSSSDTSEYIKKVKRFLIEVLSYISLKRTKKKGEEEDILKGGGRVMYLRVPLGAHFSYKGPEINNSERFSIGGYTSDGQLYLNTEEAIYRYFAQPEEKINRVNKVSYYTSRNYIKSIDTSWDTYLKDPALNYKKDNGKIEKEDIIKILSLLADFTPTPSGVKIEYGY